MFWHKTTAVAEMAVAEMVAVAGILTPRNSSNA